MTKRGLLLWVMAALIATAMPSWAAPAAPPKAGNITALLPVAKIIRGTGRKAVTTDAKKGDALVWNDLVKTEKGGRARITLSDQSILSLGSQAELRIVKHDARSQQTALEMAYGRVRAQVASITRNGGSFELRTPTAVAGVIGTDFGVDSSSVGGDTFVCLAGAVQVANSNKSVPGSVQCTAGQTTTVQPGKPPTPPQPASPQQIQQLIEETEPAIIASISPAAALPGTTFDTTIAGQNMAAVNNVSVSGSGVTATFKSASASGVQIHVAVAQGAAAGPRTITLTKQKGASSATIFTVLGPPNGDLKTGYLATLQQLTQTGIAGLGGFTAGAQQSADQIAQAVTNANLNLPKPIDLTNFANSLNQQYGTVQTALTTQNTAVQTAAANASQQFTTAYDAAYQALLQRHPDGTADDTFTKAVTAAFEAANHSLQTAIGGSQTELNGTVQTYSTNINQLQTDWIQNINSAALAEAPGPTPKVNALERDVELGATASFDASGSSGQNGASVAATSWALCSPSYQPAGFGTPLDASTPACNAIQGFTSTQSEFDVPTCSLNAGTYFVRLLLTDSNGKATPMDLKLVVTDPSYGTPAQTVQGLASAYSSLQYSPFAAFFDNNAPGISTYLNNVQNTLPTLNSMSINIISSQDTVTCNEAVTRATWQQNFTFIGAPNSLLTANEQITVYMHRTPGTGWLITNMVGDNGRVQGSLPGPLITNAAQADLEVSGASLGSTNLSNGSPSSINPGQISAQAAITNSGNADLSSAIPVVFSLLDASNAVVATSTQSLPGLAQGATANVTASLNVPTAPNGTKYTLQVNVNPGCSLQEKSCDAKNQQTYPLVLQNNVVALNNVTAAVTVSPGGANGVISLDVTSTIFPVQVCSNAPSGITLNGQGGNVCDTATAAGPVTFNVAATPQAVTGIQNLTFTASNSGNTGSGIPPAMTTTMVPVTVALPDLQFGAFTFPSALQAGATGSITLPVKNAGNADAPGGWTIVLTINSLQAGSSVAGTIVPAGQTVNFVVNYTVPSAGTPPVTQSNTAVSFLLNGNAAIAESNASNNTATATTTVSDFALTTISSSADAVAGRSFNITAVSLAPSPYPVPVNVNYTGVPAGLAASGSANNLVGGNISGTPAAAGNSTVTIAGTSSGVTHAASSSLLIQTRAEIAYANVTQNLSLLTNGPSGAISMDVSGGVYPVSVCTPQVTGIVITASNGGIKTNGIPTSPSCRTLSEPGTLTFTVSANSSASLGAQTLTFTATDAGIPASGVPAGNVSLAVPISVNGAPDLQIGTLALPVAIQMGSAGSITVPVTNSGNGPAAAGWNVVLDINNTQVGNVAGPAIPAGQSANVTVNFTTPIVGTPPQNLSNVPVNVTVNTNAAIVESNTANDVFSGTVSLVDFALTTVPTGTQTGVVGRNFSLTTVSVAPAGYPLPLTESYSGVPSGLGGNGLSLTGTPGVAGSSTITVSGTASGVTHNASASIALNIVPEITPSQSTVPSLIAGDPAQNLTVAVSGGIYPVMACVTVPTGITITAALCQTLAAPGNVTWDMKADFAAATGSNQVLAVHLTDAGVPATGTPAGDVTYGGTYSVNANANYVVTDVSWSGHTAPYTGAQGLQVGESTTLLVTVQNTGNGSPTGTITVTADCGVPAACSPPLTASAAAPAAGASVVVNLPANNISLPVATYNGTATLSTNISGAVLGPPGTLTWDVVDFTLTGVAMSPSQNLPIGGSGDVSVTLAEQLPSGSAFAIPISPNSDPNLTFTPPSQSSAGPTVAFTATVAAATPPTASPTSPDTITFSATNHGVTKMATVPVNYFSAQMVSQNNLVNDAANPLAVPIEVAAPNYSNRYPELSLKMMGNYIGGTASLTVNNPSCGTFSDTPSPTMVLPADLIDFPIYATAANCSPASLVTIQAAIPNTNPPLNLPVYNLYVTVKGLAQLQIMSMTPSRDLTSQPWLAGEPMDWTVVVKNVGSGPSTGNEQVMLSLDNAEIGKANVAGSIAPNATTSVMVHTDAPDVAPDSTFGPTISLFGHVMLDSQGDLAPGTGDFSQSVNVSNWSIGVSGNGSSDGNPLSLNLDTGLTSANTSVSVSALPSGTFNPSLTLPLVLGGYSSNQLNPSNLSPASVSSGAGSVVTVSVKNGQQPASGEYFVQVIAQMKDGANVTTQRQATIHVNVSNTFAGTGAYVSLSSDKNNIAACVVGQTCGTPPAMAQINGPLPTAFTLTAGASCSPSCSGTADISFTDSYVTNTTPQVSTISVNSPGNTLPIRVSANTNPDGTITTGSATVMASVSAVQAVVPSGARQPTPDPVGNNQYAMAVNVGDIYVSAPYCMSVQPQATAATPITLSYVVYSGFNVPSLSWEWEDSNHLPVGASPLSFSAANGTSTYSSGSYSALPTFNLSNSSTGVDGLQTYYFAVTVTNGLATATKYFPVQFDLSQGQTFCPNLGGARGSRGPGGTIIRGAWGRNSLIASSHAALRASKLPDVRVVASDLSFTPSMPKTGDTVSVRFRISNVGDVNATAVPVALQINGNIVAQDAFDVGAGKTALGALQWNNAKFVGASGGTAPSRPMARVRGRAGRVSRTSMVEEAAPPASPLTALNAMIVIDPRHTMPQKTTVAKSASLAHFSLHDGLSTASSATPMTRQRAVLELGEGACAGLRFNMGAGGCSGSADLTITVEDLAKGAYKMEAANGIADLGMGVFLNAAPNTNFSMTALAQNGHTYAVQLRGGQVGLLTMNMVRNPNQLSEAARRVFRGGPAARVIGKLGDSTATPQPQSATESKVYFDILYQGQ